MGTARESDQASEEWAWSLIQSRAQGPAMPPEFILAIVIVLGLIAVLLIIFDQIDNRH